MVFRFYSMPFVPIGFWSRLLTRLIVFTQSKFMEVSCHRCNVGKKLSVVSGEDRKIVAAVDWYLKKIAYCLS